MSFSIYTYSNPYEINNEPYWESIRNCAQFCVSQTMVNGLLDNYSELTNGQLSTVQHLVDELYADWDSTRLYIEQYALVDQIITEADIKDKVNAKKIKASLRFNKKNIVDSIRLMFELDIEFAKINIKQLSEEQKYLAAIYKAILEKADNHVFDLSRNITNGQIDSAIRNALKEANKGKSIDRVNSDTVVFHGIHQFTPIILRAIDEISKYKRVVLLFNYQNQYKNIYQTWIDVYSSFDVPIKSQFDNEFRPSILLPNSYKGNLLADKIAFLAEGIYDNDNNLELSSIEVVEFDNITEFSGYVAKVYEDALEEYEQIKKNDESTKSVLYYMKEQFYSANGDVNDILKIYFPEQFGERHFLAYPIGHFFVAVTDMWDVENGGLHIEDLSSIVECLNSGIIPEAMPGELVSTFNLTRGFFEREQNIEGIISKLKKLKKRIRKTFKNNDKEEIDELLKLNYYNISNEEIEKLIKSLEDLNLVAYLFYEDFENEENNFKSFYSKIKDFLENKVLSIDNLEDEFKDVVSRLLNRLNDIDNIETKGTFACLKETMSYYLKQEDKKGHRAKWIVRDFEQIDGDILKSINQKEDTVYHFCCLSDSNMNVAENDRFPWPLDIRFFEYAYEPFDWKYQVYVKAMKEYKNFKRYALVYGLQFNRVKFKLSYIKNEDDKVNELYYMLRILGIKSHPNLLDCINESLSIVEIPELNEETKEAFSEFDYYKWNICKYRFALESIIEGGTKYKDKFLMLKYLEVLVENYVRKTLQGQPVNEAILLQELNIAYDSIVRKFQFTINLDRVDIITNAKNYIMNEVVNKSKTFLDITDNEVEYMKKRKEFIYLKLTSNENPKENILKTKLYGANANKIETSLNASTLKIMEYDKNVAEWCKYCSNKEICLESYKLLDD